MMTAAEISVVTFESTIADIARSKPISMARAGPLLARNSSRMRSIDQHVGVDRHAHGQHDPGDAGQRQRRPDDRQDRQ